MILYRKLPLYNVRQISDKCIAASVPGQTVDMLVPIGLTMYIDGEYWVPQWIVENNAPTLCAEQFDGEYFEPSEVEDLVGCV